jgi:hypothetical protein
MITKKGTEEDRSHLPVPKSFIQNRPVGLNRRKNANGAPVLAGHALQENPTHVPRRRGRHTIDHHHKQREDAAPSSNRPSLCL